MRDLSCLFIIRTNGVPAGKTPPDVTHFYAIDAIDQSYYLSIPIPVASAPGSLGVAVCPLSPPSIGLRKVIGSQFVQLFSYFKDENHDF